MNKGNLPFSGCKLAVICDDKLLVYRRDAKQGIPYPNCWDFPGGGREGQETPEQCALRELHEEFALTFPDERIHFKRWVKSHTGVGGAYFMAIHVGHEELADIQFGDEGQHWTMMTVQEYLSHPEAIQALKDRLTIYLTENK
ncbi:NUDIX domain-containing protein [Veronia pacifica]|uniref:DNA mismatch repair protein MutT n=1 Tax=Veronia pacifica TaxID=1080227 RepID=A0A1C3EPP9_9GAMM|nr:NUDIX hydrolase [Veronia pacifica]ODA35241.1 DNA mismatch repair protein MutT [Veronia pacifica]